MNVYREPGKVFASHSAPAATGPKPCGTSVGQQSQACSAQNVTHSRDVIQPGVDQHWQQKYSHHLWFHFTPAQLAAWYNEPNQVEDILPPENNGMGLASWRGEHTASVGLREEGWVDFGARARRSDGKQDGGDGLELTVRINDEPKPEVMRQLVSEAREALESAAHTGEQLPQ